MFRLAIILSLLFSSGSFALSDSQKREIKKSVDNMKAVLPRRVDQMTTVVDTWMRDNTWYMKTVINIGDRKINQKIADFISEYIKDQYCRPPWEYIDAGLNISNQYYDQRGNYLFVASANKRICGR